MSHNSNKIHLVGVATVTVLVTKMLLNILGKIFIGIRNYTIRVAKLKIKIEISKLSRTLVWLPYIVWVSFWVPFGLPGSIPSGSNFFSKF